MYSISNEGPEFHTLINQRAIQQLIKKDPFFRTFFQVGMNIDKDDGSYDFFLGELMVHMIIPQFEINYVKSKIPDAGKFDFERIFD